MVGVEFVDENTDLVLLVTGRLVDKELRSSSVLAACTREIDRCKGVQVVFAE